MCAIDDFSNIFRGIVNKWQKSVSLKPQHNIILCWRNCLIVSNRFDEIETFGSINFANESSPHK